MSETHTPFDLATHIAEQEKRRDEVARWQSNGVTVAPDRLELLREIDVLIAEIARMREEQENRDPDYCFNDLLRD